MHHRPVLGQHVVEQGLQGALAEVPLKYPEAHPLPVKIAAQTAKALGRCLARLEGAGQGQTLADQRLVEQIRLGNIFRKQGRPGVLPTSPSPVSPLDF